MGNCPATACVARGSVHNWAEEEEDGDEGMIKVVRATDGELFEYPGPSVAAKDVVRGFEGFAVFHYDSVKQPLPPEAQLERREVYYLRPWKGPPPALRGSRTPERTAAGQEACGAAAAGEAPRAAKESGKVVKRVRFADDVRHASSAVPAAPASAPSPTAAALLQHCHDQILATAALQPPGTGGGVVRVKVVISKQQLRELMQAPQPRGRPLRLPSPAGVLLDSPFLPPPLPGIVVPSCPAATCA